ncbi:unnamed protein product [Paramecium octaurelia]|uniref:Small ribosomal subunit protein eS1 n=1 Tax=Paramecium octaurelia TaxID=43137 RepID=A0A8S1UEC1_PAROT|nr:unnamed protein product [Paramecium octaurelia]
MTQGKNKKLGKKKGQKKTIDPLARKEWFELTAPVPFAAGGFGYTCINKSAGTVVATEAIKGRVVEASLADLQGQSDQMAWRKVKLIIDDVEGTRCRTSFYGLDSTKDKIFGMIKKRQTLIETQVEARSQDGYILRIFVIAFTKSIKNQQRKTTYAQRSQIKDIRKKIVEIVLKEVSKKSITQLLGFFNQESLAKEIGKATRTIFPLQNITLRKVKLVKRPKVDAQKLREFYDDSNRAKTAQVRRKGQAEDQTAVNLIKQGEIDKEQAQVQQE